MVLATAAGGLVILGGSLALRIEEPRLIVGVVVDLAAPPRPLVTAPRRRPRRRPRDRPDGRLGRVRRGEPARARTCSSRAGRAVKAVNGWTSTRLHAPGTGTGDGVGAQVLLRRPGPLPWAFAYAPRGPVLERWDADGDRAVHRRSPAQGLRSGASGAGRVSHLRIDPEIERGAGPDDGGAVTAALAAAGWAASPPVQPVSTRVIDLAADEAALWGDLRKKWRQYVNKARTGGVRVVDAGPERLDDFYRDLPRDRRPGGVPDPRPVAPTATCGTRSGRRATPGCCSPSWPTGRRSRRCSSCGRARGSWSRTAA